MRETGKFAGEYLGFGRPDLDIQIINRYHYLKGI